LIFLQTLRELTLGILRQMNNQLHNWILKSCAVDFPASCCKLRLCHCCADQKHFMNKPVISPVTQWRFNILSIQEFWITFHSCNLCNGQYDP
jgi:hypothetical protein